MKLSCKLPETLNQVLIERIPHAVKQNVDQALTEDIGAGDITASLIPANRHSKARVICRDQAIICGRPWFDEVFRQIDSNVQISWHIQEGQLVNPNQVLVDIQGSARSLLTGERSAINFLQVLSGTATHCRHYANLVSDTDVKLLDTRKTIPGLRVAQKYAVSVGGCYNHRIGLYDCFLIKENHIAACGGISQAVARAHQIAPGKHVEVEVENKQEFTMARNSGANIIMLDNFSLADLTTTVQINLNLPGKAPKLEASGGIDEQTLLPIAKTGVDFISMGLLTKNCQSIDLSMRVIDTL